MNQINWNYVKPLQDQDAITAVCSKYRITLDETLLAILTNYNGGRPTPNTFDTAYSREREFKSLLSYNKNDLETIYHIYSQDFIPNSLFPFAIDPAGNYICVNLDNQSVHLLLHETLMSEPIASSSFEFFKNLY